MASSLSRRLILTSSKLLLLRQHPNLNPTQRFLSHSQTIINPYPSQNPSFIQFLKPFSSSPNPSPSPSPSPRPNPNPDPNGFKHQEIEGPTVDRDDSALANETREVLTSLRKSIYDLSSSLALLGIAHLGLGAYIAYESPAAADAVSSVQGLAAFAFPFSVAFLMRRSLKPMSFFQRMEEQGRLQILTLSLQSAKSLRVLFLRVRVASICCVVGISGGALVAMWLR